MKRRLISIMLVIAMVLSVVPATVFATEAEVETPKLKYVSLGDSMSNGYGLDGYHGNTGVEDYGDASYAEQFAQYLNAEHAQLAMSAMRAEDLHWLLEVNCEDPAVEAVINELAASGWNEDLWYSVFTNGDYWTWNELVNNYRFDVAAYCIEGKDNGTDFYVGTAKAEYTDMEALHIVAEYYQTSVKEADIVSLGMGNGNFGVFMFGRITDAIGFTGTPDETLVYNIENALRECTEEQKAEIYKLMAEAEAILAENGIFVDDGDDTVCSTMEALYNSFMYAVVSYALNYAGSVEAILQLNPDAEIIQVALMNTMVGEDGAEEGTVGYLMGLLFDPLNAYIAALPTVMQAAGNSVYADATFYWAEADYVACIVDTYEAPLNDTVRDRFVESIVGDGEGMIWSLLGDMVESVTAADIAEYEELNEAGKLAYAAGDPDKAKSIAIYLAFENAVIANKFTPVTVDSVLGLGGALDFEAIMEAYYAQAAVAGADKLDTVAAFIAATMEAALEAQANAMLASKGFVDVTVDMTVTAAEVKAVLAGVAGAIDVIAQNAVDAICAAADCDEATLDYVLGTSAKTYIAGEIADQIPSADEVALLCTLLVTPDVLGNVLSESEMKGLLALFGRCVIGNGIGSHPSEAGHKALYEAVKAAYENNYTSNQKTLETVLALIAEYYDDAYAYAYAYAAEAGYINTAVAGIDGVIAQLNAIKEQLEVAPTAAGVQVASQMTPAFKAELVVQIAKTIETLEAAKALLVEADVLDQATLDALMATLNESAETIAHLEHLLVQAGVDVNQLAIIPALKAAHKELTEVVIPQILSDLEEAVKAGTAYLMEKLGEAYDALVEAIINALQKYLPELDAAIYDYLYNNPEEVIGFFKTYGPTMLELAAEYGDEALLVVGYVLVNYGDEIAAFFVENDAAILAALIHVAEEHGEDIIALIQVYAEALGLCDAVRAQIVELEKALALLEAQLEALKAQLENASAEVKAELEAKIAELEAKIAEIKAAIEELKAAVEAAVEKGLADLAAMKAAIEELNEKVAALVKAAEEAAIKEIENAIAAVKAAAENLDELVAELLGDLYEGLQDVVSELLEKALEQLKKWAPKVADAIYNYLYNHPEEVIAFITEHGDLIAEYGEKALAVLGYLLYTYGDEVVEFILENHEEIFEVIISWLEIHGENTWALVQVYLNALGITDCANTIIDGVVAAVTAEVERAKAELEAAINELKAMLKSMCDCVAEKKAELEALYAELADLYAQLENAKGEAKAAIEAAIAEIEALIAEIEAAIAEIEAAIEEIKAAIAELEAMLAELIDALKNLGDALNLLEEAIAYLIKEGFNAGAAGVQAALDAVAEALEELVAIVSEEIAAQIDEVLENLKAMLNERYLEITHGEYLITPYSYLIGLGDGTATSTSYVENLAAAMAEISGQYYSYENLSQTDLMIQDIYPVILDNAAEIARADLITLGFGNNGFTNFTVNYLLALINGESVELDWVTYVGEEGLPYVEKMKAKLYDELLSAGVSGQYMGIDITDLMVSAVEAYAYCYAAYTFNLPEVVETIHTINPEAQVIVVGMYNPLENVVLNIEGNLVDIGSYLAYAVDAANVSAIAYAMITGDVIYVDAPDVDVKNDKTEMSVINLITEIIVYKSANLIPTAEGHAYITEQILNALTITVQGLLGDADNNGVVNLLDALVIMQYYTDMISAEEIALGVSDVDGNGTVNLVDAMLIMQYYTGIIEKFPVEA